MKDNEHTREHKEMMLIKYLKEKGVEQIKIDKARYNWNIIRKKMKVIHVMRNFSPEKVSKLYAVKREKNPGSEQLCDEHQVPSKLIITPKNFFKMHFNNVMLIVLILYVFIVPLYVSFSPILEKGHL